MTLVRATDDRLIDAPINDAWSVLADVAAYPSWWPPSLGVSVVVAPDNLMGAVIRIAPSGGRPFTCRVVGVHPPTVLDMEYPGPFIYGTGQWRLTPDGSRTRVAYRIDARAAGWLAWILSAVVDFGGVHSRQMQHVFDALAHACGRRFAIGVGNGES